MALYNPQLVDRPFTIQLPSQPLPEADYESASKHIKPMPQNAVVEMAPAPEKAGQWHLPSEVAARLRPDAGTLVTKGEGLPDAEPGDQVLVRPYGGNWFDNFSCGEYEAEGQVRVYGVASPNDREHVLEGAEKHIVGKLEGETGIRAIGCWVFIKRDAPTQTVSDILLIDDEAFRPGTATVVSAGSRAFGPEGEPLEPGDRVLYHGNSIVLDTLDVSKRFGLSSDHVFIRSTDLYAVIA